MSIFDTIKELLSGTSDHVANIQDTVQGISEGDIAQQITDTASDLGANVQDSVGGLNEKAQDIATNVKDGLGK